jgi:hypothetical protein
MMLGRVEPTGSLRIRIVALSIHGTGAAQNSSGW